MSKLILPAHYSKTALVSFLAMERDGIIAVIDLYPCLPPASQAITCPVTKAPQIVINELARRGFPINDRCVMYLDENGIWDRIIVKNGNFDNFQVFHADSWQKVIDKMLFSGLMTKKELKRPPVVDQTFSVNTSV